MEKTGTPHSGRRRCPRCRTYTAVRSHRRGAFENIVLRFLLMRPFRCRDCNHRFYALRFELSQPVSNGNSHSS